MSTPQEQSPKSVAEPSESSDERIIHSIYNHLLTSVCITYAGNLHELIKTGELPTSALVTPSSRREVFPELYRDKTDDQVQTELDQYATEIYTRPSRKRKLPPAPSGKPLDAIEESEEEFQPEDKKSLETEAADPKTSGLDIWGRHPPKEPKYPVECQLCSRPVSSTRFASHLEKCMGLSTRPLNGAPARSATSVKSTNGIQ